LPGRLIVSGGNVAGFTPRPTLVLLLGVGGLR
jgi:hypothetical protein